MPRLTISPEPLTPQIMQALPLPLLKSHCGWPTLGWTDTNTIGLNSGGDSEKSTSETCRS